MDAVLRELIRRARASGDPQDRARAIAAWLRAGGRDPREDPRPGDVVRVAWGEVLTVVAVRGGKTRRHNRVEFQSDEGRTKGGDVSLGIWWNWTREVDYLDPSVQWSPHVGEHLTAEVLAVAGLEL